MKTNVNTTGAGSAQPKNAAITALFDVAGFENLTDPSHRNFVEVVASLKELAGAAVDQDSLQSLCQTLELLERFRENEPEMMGLLRSHRQQASDLLGVQ